MSTVVVREFDGERWVSVSDYMKVSIERDRYKSVLIKVRDEVTAIDVESLNLIEEAVGVE